MIIVQLIGGLGNQMFQYALARHLSEKLSAVLKLDITAYETYKLHKYSLSCFNIREHFATKNEINKLLNKKHNKVRNFLDIIFSYLGKEKKHLISYIIEKNNGFDKKILELTLSDLYLVGYWQSDKYFKESEDIIRREFIVQYPQDKISKEISKSILSCESISLHIRRAEYLNPQTLKKHGVMDMAYYDRCVMYLVQRVENPHFFVFSDDKKWGHENIKLDYPTTFIDHTDASTNFETLRLSTQCRHHIIANSTFGWWGAWLSPNPDKMVIAPKQWFADEKMNKQTQDLIPESWIRV